MRWTMMRTSELTRTDQKFLSRARSRPVELQTRARGIDLHIKGGRLDRFLFVTAQSSKTIGEGVGNAEFHRGSGQWLVVSGQWSVVSGQWSVVSG